MPAMLPSDRTRFVTTWVVALASVYLALGIFSLVTIEAERLASHRNHELRMDPKGVEPGRTPPEPLTADAEYVNVHVGVYVDNIDELSIVDSFWTARFYIWFRWNGDKLLDPGKHFHIVDGIITKMDRVTDYHGADGTNYQRFKVTAKLDKFFNTTRIPLDDHMLNIYIEDAARGESKLRYVADESSNVSSRITVPGYRITGHSSVVKPHTYKTGYGDPRSANGTTTFTEYIFAITIKRAGLSIYVKLFMGLFAGVMLTIGSFYIRPADTSPRFGVPSAAYFGAVANAYLVNASLPSSGDLGLADLVTYIGLFTIFACFVSSLVSVRLYLISDEKELSRRLDRACCYTIGVAFLVVNIALPLAAYM